MRRFACWLPLLLTLILPHAAFAVVYNMGVAPDHKDRIYKVGEEVIFRIAVRADGRSPVGQQISYTITKDDGSQVSAGSVQLAAGPSVVKAKADAPGVLRCIATFAAGGVTINEGGVAIIAPEQFKASLPPPDDFDQFWDAQRKLLAAKPAEPTTKPVKLPERLSAPLKSAASSALITDVEAPTIEGVAPLHAYLARPKYAKPKTLPAILFPPSTAVHEFRMQPGTPTRSAVAVMDSDIGRVINAAKSGMLAMSYNVHGIANGQDGKAYQSLAQGELKDSLTTGLADRETHPLRGVMLRQLRAIEFLTAQPEWNGKVLIVRGDNVGGGLALAAAGLEPRITLCIAESPGLCDLTAGAGELSWPRVGSGGDEKSKQAARYFDAANFATRIKCQAVVVPADSPEAPLPSVYAAFANIPTTPPTKQLIRPDGVTSYRDLIAQLDGLQHKHITAQAAAPR